MFASSTRSAGAPGGQPAPSEVGTRRILTIGAIAGGWAAVAGLACVAVLVLVAWLAGGMREDVSDALALAVHGWLLGLGAAVAVPGGELSVMPLGLTLLQGVLVYRAARKATDVAEVRDGRSVAGLVAAFAATFGLVAAATAALAVLPLVQSDPAEAFGRAAALAAAASCWGVVNAGEQGQSLRRRLVSRLPDPVWEVLRAAGPAAAAAVATLLGCAALLVTIWMVVGFADVTALVESLGADPAGLLVLLLASLALLPTLIVWSLAYITGVGFSLGAGSSVTPLAVQVGALPGLPLVAAIPQDAVAFGPFFLGLPWAAGGLAAALILRRGRHLQGRPRWLAAAAVATALLAASASAVLAELASGAAGPGRLGISGPAPWQVGLAVGGPVLVTCMVVLAVSWVRSRPTDAASEPEPVEDRLLKV